VRAVLSELVRSATLVRMADLRGGRMQNRLLVPDLYELTDDDGRTVRVHRKLRKKWDATIRRLLRVPPRSREAGLPLVGRGGIEPPTLGLRVPCSTS
jgi:hypothetical protein